MNFLSFFIVKRFKTVNFLSFNQYANKRESLSSLTAIKASPFIFIHYYSFLKLSSADRFIARLAGE